MSVAVLAAVVVGGAFLLAGGAKIAAGRAWPEQARALGAPGITIRFVPWIEILLGALLCAQVARQMVAALAALLLVVFTGLLVKRMMQGQRPPCACFGSWSAQPLGWRHLARNAALLAAAVVAIVVR